MLSDLDLRLACEIAADDSTPKPVKTVPASSVGSWIPTDGYGRILPENTTLCFLIQNSKTYHVVRDLLLASHDIEVFSINLLLLLG